MDLKCLHTSEKTPDYICEYATWKRLGTIILIPLAYLISEVDFAINGRGPPITSFVYIPGLATQAYH
jgi:hypothetical protein